MIAVHRITQPDHELYVNPDLIQVIEANPDTVIVLANGTRFVVAETADRGRVELVRQRRASIVDRRRAPVRRDRPPGRLRPPRRRGRAARDTGSAD